jgi:hypothetical protein
MQSAAFRRHALVPKPRNTDRCAVHTFEITEVAYLFRTLASEERRVLAAIVETADLLLVDGAPPHLLVPAPEWFLDALSEFAAELEDLEPGADDEENGDREHDDCDREASVERGPVDAWTEAEGGDEASAPPPGARKSREAFIATRRRDPKQSWFEKMKAAARAAGIREDMKSGVAIREELASGAVAVGVGAVLPVTDRRA